MFSTSGGISGMRLLLEATVLQRGPNSSLISEGFADRQSLRFGRTVERDQARAGLSLAA
jgi:hypothetical protein